MENKHLPGVIAESGRPGFWPLLHADICDVVPHEMMGVFLYGSDTPPTRLYDSRGGANRDNLHAILAEVGYLISPYFNRLIRPRAPADFYHLSDVAPDDFLNSEYYRAYYVKKGVRDEGMYHVPLSDGRTVVIMIEQTHRMPALGAAERLALRNASPMIVALVANHFRLLDRGPSIGDMPQPVGFRNVAERFGAEILSNRERDVAMLILRGHSSKSAARELGIAPETERVHRRRLYAKLDISSHSELFWLFFESSEYFDPATRNDPLAAYMRQRAASVAAI